MEIEKENLCKEMEKYKKMKDDTQKQNNIFKMEISQKKNEVNKLKQLNDKLQKDLNLEIEKNNVLNEMIQSNLSPRSNDSTNNINNNNNLKEPNLLLKQVEDLNNILEKKEKEISSINETLKVKEENNIKNINEFNKEKERKKKE